MQNTGLAFASPLLLFWVMPIQYYLRPNPLPGREAQFMAQVVSVEKVSEAGLIDHMAASSTMLNRDQIASAMQTLEQTVTSLIADGNRVTVAGLAQFFPVMSGKFKGADDEFDKKRHELGVAAAVGVKLVEEVKSRAVAEKQKPTEQLPTPTYYKETGTRAVTGKVIAGNIGTIHGRRLALDPKVTDEGVFFVSSEAPKKEVRVKVYASVQPTQIVFQVPEGLGAGLWVLEVRARLRGGKQLRSGRLSSPLEAVSNAST